MLGPIYKTVEEPSEQPRDTWHVVSRYQEAILYQTMCTAHRIVRDAVFELLLNNATRVVEDALFTSCLLWSYLLCVVTFHLSRVSYAPTAKQNKFYSGSGAGGPTSPALAPSATWRQLLRHLRPQEQQHQHRQYLQLCHGHLPDMWSTRAIRLMSTTRWTMLTTTQPCRTIVDLSRLCNRP